MAINSRQRRRRVKKKAIVCKPSTANVKSKISTRNVSPKAKKKKR